MLRPKTQRDELDPDSTDLFQTNILDYYKDRPNSLEDISLFIVFASLYTLCSGTDASKSSPRSREKIQLKSLKKVFRQRQTSTLY